MSIAWTGTALPSPTGATLNLRSRRATSGSRAIVLIHHGLAEHAGRYKTFADLLADRGFHVMAHDHRGHGQTTAEDAPLRRFAKADGADAVLRDCRAVHLHALETFGPHPVVVVGHSMGGLIALNYAQRHGGALAGAAIWNANFDRGLQERTAQIGLKAEKALKGSDVASALLSRGTFESWGRSIENRRTMADWLSHDEAEVDAYLADPLCGWTPTVSMYEDVLALVFDGGDSAALARLPITLPLHLLGGSADPATAKGRAVLRLAERLTSAGHQDVTALVVEGARHETLNEVAAYREPALRSLFAWLDRVALSTAESDQRDA